MGLSHSLLCFLILGVFVSSVSAQTASESQPEADGRADGPAGPEWSLQPSHPSLERMVVPNILADQKAFWTAPSRARADDVAWAVPFVAATSLLIGSDTSIEQKLPTNHRLIQRSQDFSNLGAASLISAAGAFYFSGRLGHNDHARETGLLGGEALINGLLDASLMQVAARRNRPLEGDGKGKFWQDGSSFPSEHAAAAWSVATVVAHEYPGTMTKLLSYGLASAVSVSRVTGREHFASDVFIGSALGWYEGRQIYRAHHNPELGGAGWADTVETGDRSRKAENMGSPYVPLDSWVYPVFERLAALGYVPTAYLGVRPWTRMECARLIEEAGGRSQDGEIESGEGKRLRGALAEEFADESARLNGASNLGVSLDSIYTRITGISSSPLRDGYHFAQTVVNDFGRPYGEGFNAVSGITAHVVAGPFAFDVRGEYQHAPSTPSDPLPVLQATASADGTPVLADAQPRVDRFCLLDSTIAATINNVQFSVGKQSLWLGPSAAGPLLFSDNAEPIPMLRIDSVSPYKLPLFSRWLGPVRSEFFLGRLSGQHWVAHSPSPYGPNISDQPFIHGTKFSFKPTPNLEFGMDFTALFAGPGLPFTWSNFIQTFYSHKATREANPGKRFSGFDFSYHIPGLRRWVVLYSDSLVIDEYSPLGSNRPSLNPGIYLPRLPKLSKMDLRLEGVTTDLPTMHFRAGDVYSDGHYLDGYTNNGNLLGNWVGRMGRGEQAWATYWLSTRNKIQVGYRHNDVDKAFVGGGRFHDASLKTELMLRHDLGVSAWVQYEDWRFPVLSPLGKTNVSTSVELTMWPRWMKK